MEHLTECEQHDMGEECERCADPCEVFPAVEVVTVLSALSANLEGMHLPDMSDYAKAHYLRTIADAVRLLRTHALPDSHPWGIE